MKDDRPTNRLLAGLSNTDWQMPQPILAPIDLPRGLVLVEPGEPFSQVIFPNDAVISTVGVLADGETVEMSTTDCEGMISPILVLGGTTAVNRSIVQVAGSGLSLPIESFHHLCSEGEAFHSHMLAYVRA